MKVNHTKVTATGLRRRQSHSDTTLFLLPSMSPEVDKGEQLSREICLYNQSRTTNTGIMYIETIQD